jgi:hypothetical protein
MLKPNKGNIIRSIIPYMNKLLNMAKRVKAKAEKPFLS